MRKKRKKNVEHGPWKCAASARLDALPCGKSMEVGKLLEKVAADLNSFAYVPTEDELRRYAVTRSIALADVIVRGETIEKCKL